MKAKNKSKPNPAKKLRLLASLKEKRHYLVIKPADSEKTFEEKEFKDRIDKAILDFIGVLGYSEAGPLYIEIRKDYAVVSIITKYVDRVKASLSFYGLRCVGVSGTIKKSRRFL